MTDEKYVFTQDVREKKITARSARNTRTHNGKRGAVKFPSDYLSKKELQAMNGEVKSYRLNEPMKWDEFKTMPDDLKVAYINALRTKFDVPDNEIANMLGVDRQTVGRWFRCLGLGLGKCAGGRKTWDKERWVAWCNGVPFPSTVEENTAVEESNENAMASLEEICEPEPVVFASDPEVKVLPVREEKAKAIPTSGNMAFEGPIESVLNTISILLGGANVRLSVTWEVCLDHWGCEAR